jgi:hypothetical protein
LVHDEGFEDLDEQVAYLLLQFVSFDAGEDGDELGDDVDDVVGDDVGFET